MEFNTLVNSILESVKKESLPTIQVLYDYVKGKPVHNIPIKKLLHELKPMSWEKGEERPGTKEFIKRAKATNLRYPIIVFKINTDELQHTFSNKHKFTLSIDLRIHSNETNFLISPKNYNNLMSNNILLYLDLENIILKEKDLINHSKNCLIEKKHDKINYNFLSLRKNVNFTKLLIEDYSLKVVDQIFSDKINIIDDHCKKFSKFIFITSNSSILFR